MDTKVPEIKTDKDMEILNRNFNLMTDQLKNQQEKLLINERHEAWEISKKTCSWNKESTYSIQLTIDRIKNKYLDKISNNDQEILKKTLKLLITKLNKSKILLWFSDFANA